MSTAHQELLRICNGCGEIFDAKIEVEAIHHGQTVHVPLLPRRKQWRRPVITVARRLTPGPGIFPPQTHPGPMDGLPTSQLEGRFGKFYATPSVRCNLRRASSVMCHVLSDRLYETPRCDAQQASCF